MLFSCCLCILKKQEPVVCGLGDNARPPCKAWKWEEKEEGSVAAPASPPGGDRDRGGGGILRVRVEENVDIMGEGGLVEIYRGEGG